QNQGKAKGLAACNSQTASPFGCLNNFYFEILSNFLGSLHVGVALFLCSFMTYSHAPENIDILLPCVYNGLGG
ncbi:hypothetical protein, partial [Hominenteromicrobium sp.]|uniref:hypothetical protein n=1 Tax=Hominenteromicrobium sp. TaxID=3073581 RepID=UPI003AB78461